MARVKIGKRTINGGRLDAPFIVAEAGVNHEGSLEKAKIMIDEVAKAGGDAIKFQAYRATSLAVKNSPAYWDRSQEPTRTQYALFRKNEGFWKREFQELAKHAKSRKIEFLATPFDLESADFLEPLVPAYKIASADITTKPLIQHIARKGKPIIMSTGAATVSEIWRALEWVENVSDVPVVLLHCVLDYPTKAENASLGSIRAMSSIFPDSVIGYSDHTQPPVSHRILEIAWLLGAALIEKHYTWNKGLKGNDHYHSFDFADLVQFIRQTKLVRGWIGKLGKRYQEDEGVSREFARRSLVAATHIKQGATIRPSDVTWKRPGTGIPPWLLEFVVGGKALRTIPVDKVLSFQDVILRKGSVL